MNGLDKASKIKIGRSVVNTECLHILEFDIDIANPLNK